MTLLVNIPDRPIAKLVEKLQQELGADKVSTIDSVENPQQVSMALVWKHKPGSLNQFPNLKGISSFGAGVDAILHDKSLPHLPIARIVDPNLSHAMFEYVLMQVLNIQQRSKLYAQNQQNAIWKPRGRVKVNTIGVLGLGEIGGFVAHKLADFGFNVMGWSKTAKNIAGVDSKVGTDGFTEVVSTSDIVICLLPLTSETCGILNQTVFEQMRPNATLINVARGEHVNEDDLLDALDKGQLDSAILDVFCQEPLGSEHTFWRHPKITITPHISAVTNIDTVVAQIVDNYHRLQNGLPMLNTINLAQGY